MTTTERKPHPHAEVIKAWADGCEVQFWHGPTETWEDVTVRNPPWSESTKYRVKPEPKKPTTWYQVVYLSSLEKIPHVSIQLVSDQKEADRLYGPYVVELIPIYTEENVE